jgi:hypothetical protein
MGGKPIGEIKRGALDAKNACDKTRLGYVERARSDVITIPVRPSNGRRTDAR